MSEPQPTQGTWILDVRSRLQAPPPRRGGADLAAHAAFVPLYVDAGELWTVLSESEQSLALDWGTVAFTGGGLESGEEPWEVIARVSEAETGVPAEQVLKLGELDEVDTLHGFSVIPCVAAVPPPAIVEGSEECELVCLPLRAFGDSRLIEERKVELEGREAWIRVYHVGRQRVAGTAAQILESLTQRLDAERERTMEPLA